MIVFNNASNAIEYLKKYSGYGKKVWQNKNELQILIMASRVKERREKLINDLVNFCEQNRETCHTSKVPYSVFSIIYISSLKYTELMQLTEVYKIIELENKNYQYLSRCYSFEELIYKDTDELRIISKEVNIKISKRPKKPQTSSKNVTVRKIYEDDDYEDYEPEIRTLEERRLMGISDDATTEEKLRYGVVDEEVHEEKNETDILDEVYEMIDTILASHITTKEFEDLYKLSYDELKKLYTHANNKLASEEQARNIKKM